MMFSRSKGVLVFSALALSALHCGGSTPESNTAEAAANDPNMTTQSELESSGALSDSAPENAAQGSSMNLNDQQIALITESVNKAEIEQARLAQKKSKNERVRQFASMMIEHHGHAQQQQGALNISTAESPLSQQLTTESERTLQQLQQASGDDFDRAYLDAQVQAHTKVLHALQTELRPNAQSAELQTYLQNLQPTVAEHLTQALAAQKELPSGSLSSATSGGPSSQ